MTLAELLLAASMAASASPTPTPTLMPFPIRSCNVANDDISRSNANCYRHLAYVVEKEGRPVINRDPFYHATELRANDHGRIILYVFFNLNEESADVPSDSILEKEYSFLRKGFDCDFMTVTYIDGELQRTLVDIGLSGNMEVWTADPKTRAMEINTNSVRHFKRQYDFEFVAPLLLYYKEKYPIPELHST